MVGTKLVAERTQNVILTLCPTLQHFFHKVEFSIIYREIIMIEGNTAWILTSTALVLFMTLPGLALFYGGLVYSKNLI